jgi:hypothetical protein
VTSQKEIRYLCLRVFVAQGNEEYQVRLAELRTALRKPVRGATNLGIFLIMKPKPNGVGAPERAASKGLIQLPRRAEKNEPPAESHGQGRNIKRREE